jgi:hypothetical protein
LGHTRAFLYHEIGLTHLFRGDGFTRTEDGQVGACPHTTLTGQQLPPTRTQISHGSGTHTHTHTGLREYLVPNRPLSSFSKYRTVELPLDLAELPPEEVIPDP